MSCQRLEIVTFFYLIIISANIFYCS
jgi:hypothetical protein